MDKDKNKASRRLTRKEQKRFDEFLDVKEEYIAQGFKEDSLTMSGLFVNVMANVIGLGIVAIAFILFIFVNKNRLPDSFDIVWPVVVVAFIVLIVVHELIHGIFWSLGAKNGFKDIAFGFALRSLTPYSTCKTPLSKGFYILGASAPGIILGIIPLVISILICNPTLLVITLINTVAAGGDLLVIIKILSYKASGKEVVYLDHPTDIGLIAFVR